ncbi:hypothetical protein DFH08DRAFT_939861 [Mycena albidolilacea]|uniref:BTB domain-containing protein n=1 Tax=Mycena albidolilacea TaxID=1033008 RepID=A0AAD6ZQU7_9AGAR|nr:hypothetical protein DFH08DRAFT_939861 [Mycena albidolilacea]
MACPSFPPPAQKITCNNENPFNDEGADIIVRSVTDNVDFRVHKTFLSVASSVFRDMLSLPQSEPQLGSGFSAEFMKDGLHIVTLDEDEETLSTLLRMCYPGWMLMDCGPLFPTIERVLAVFTAATKYAMDGVERAVRAVLVSPRFVEPDPLRVFALAVRHGLYEEARICARYTLRTPVLGKPYKPELECITAGAYHRLQEYHVRCGAAAQRVGQDVRWITNETWVWFECSPCRGNTAVVMAGERRKWVARWWADFLAEASNALRERPSGATVAINSEVVNTAVERASTCATCRSRAFREMHQFCGLFAAEADKATETVEVEFMPKLMVA